MDKNTDAISRVRVCISGDKEQLRSRDSSTDTHAIIFYHSSNRGSVRERAFWTMSSDQPIKTEFLSGKRIYLRAVEDEDIALLHALGSH